MSRIIRRVLIVLLFIATIYILGLCVSYIIWKSPEFNMMQVVPPYFVLFCLYLGVRRWDDRQRMMKE